MDLFEYQGKQLFARYGIPVSAGRRGRDRRRGGRRPPTRSGIPVVVKAQVLVGGRGKAGGVKLAADADEVRTHAGNILGLDIKGHVVQRVWIEHASDIAEEYYASFTLDRAAKKYLGMLSAQGGVEIEQVAESDPDAIARIEVDPVDGLSERAVPGVGRGGEVEPGGDRRRGRHLDEAVRGVRRRRRRPRRDQPADPHARRRGARARRQGVRSTTTRGSAIPSGTSSPGSRSSTRASAKRRRRVCSTSGSTATSA